jgi:hypothetical protein
MKTKNYSQQTISRGDTKSDKARTTNTRDNTSLYGDGRLKKAIQDIFKKSY